MFLMVVIALLGTGLLLLGTYDVEAAYRYAAFNVISVVTTTGYATTDYSLWGNTAVALFFGLTFEGAAQGPRRAASRFSASRSCTSC